jgi:hypothetical protein
MRTAKFPKKVICFFSVEQEQKIREVAEKEKMSFGEVIRIAIDAYYFQKKK